VWTRPEVVDLGLTLRRRYGAVKIGSHAAEGGEWRRVVRWFQV